jgi:multimeric flavodoxin WrbA
MSSPARSTDLAKMVARCRSAFAGEVTVVDINELDMKGDCLGCIECGGDYHCAYTGKDEFIEFYRSTVMTADVLVYAGRMVDRYLSARWKTFFDRSFFNTHTPGLTGKQVALVISGPLSQNQNLMEIFEGYFQFQSADLAGVVSDESGDSADLERLLDGLMERALAFSQAGYVHPQTFLGVGGMMIFRDDIYGRLRIAFAADHRAFRRLGLYKTFPQRELGTRAQNVFVAPILNLSHVRRRFDKMIKKQMVQPHIKAVTKH